MHRLLNIVAAAIVLCVLVPSSIAGAQPRVAGAAANQPGFPLTLPGGSVDRQSPVVADVRPDLPGLEVAIATNEGTLSLVSSAGQVLWSSFVPVKECSGTDRLNSNPAVGKLYGGDVEYIVIGYGNIRGRSDSRYCPGGVAAFDGRNGNLVWRLDTDQLSPKENLTGVYSTPALADVDGDGTMEVAFGSFDRYFYLLDHTGQLIWRFQAADTIWSSPAFADVDGDKRLDVVTGSDITAGGFPGIVTGGFVYAFKTIATTQTNKTIPFSPTPSKIENLIWRSQNYTQYIQSAPAIADLDGDGKQEVIFGAGCLTTVASQADIAVQVLDAATGATRLSIPIPTCTRSSPAIGDIDGDGKLDIVINMSGVSSYGGNGLCNTLAFRADGSTIWAANPRAAGVSDPGCDVLQAPVIADVDGNGSLEVLTTSAVGVVVLDGHTGAQLSDDAPPSLSTNGSLTHGTPAIGDLDGNGVLEVTLAAGPRLYAWTNISDAIDSAPDTSKAAFSAPWPMFHGTASRTGTVAQQPTLQLSVGKIVVLVGAQSGPQVRTIGFANLGAGALAWSATADQQWLTLSKANGTTPDTLAITIDPAVLGNRLGSYSGAITISSSAPITLKSPSSNTLAASTTVTVQLTIVGNASSLYLPVVRK